MKTIIILLLTTAFLTASAQDAVILDRNIQLFISFNGKPAAFASNSFDIYINKATGEFRTTIQIDNLYMAIASPEMSVTGENKGKILTVSGVLPVNDVLDNNSTVMNAKFEMNVNFNNIDYKTSFTFNILRMQPNGFSVMASGSFPHSVFEIKNLNNATDELGIQLSFTGF